MYTPTVQRTTIAFTLLAGIPMGCAASSDSSSSGQGQTTSQTGLEGAGTSGSSAISGSSAGSSSSAGAGVATSSSCSNTGTTSDAGSSGVGTSSVANLSASSSTNSGEGSDASSGAGVAAATGGDASAGGDSAPATSSDGGAGEGGEAVAGIPGGVAGPGTTLAGCMVFPPDNPWNVAVDGPDVQVIHTYDTQIPQTTALHPDFGGYTSNIGGIPFNVVDAGQQDLTIDFTLFANESDPGPGGWIGVDPVTAGSPTGETAWPFFVGMQIEDNPPPGGTPGNLPGDQHGLILQQGANGCSAFEAWNCVVVSAAPFSCANGAVFDLTSNALRPLGWTSADAAGLAILPGLVKLSEVGAGTITHAIRMTFNTTQMGYILPATHSAGSEPLGSAFPPMGLRLRMKASVPTSSFTAASQVIMAAMKKYGLIVADNGSDWFFQGDSNDGWNALAPDGNDTLIDEITADFKNITGSDFEVVYSGDPIATGL